MGDPRWLNLARKTWRPFQQWGIAIPAVIYAFKGALGYSFDVATFGALAGAGGLGFMARGVEQAVKTHSTAKYSQYDSPEGDA